MDQEKATDIERDGEKECKMLSRECRTNCALEVVDEASNLNCSE